MPGASAILTGRLLTVSALPTVACLFFVLTLVWAGAPGALRFKEAWETVAGLGPGEVFVVFLGALLVALVGHPLQLPLVRLFEGYWPERAARLEGLGRARQRRLRGPVVDLAAVPDDAAAVRAAGQAWFEQRRRFPDDGLLRPTRLGNVLAAMDSRAGQRYGLDAVVVWPRIFPLASDRVRAVVMDRRDQLDGSVRWSAALLLTSVVAAGLLWDSGWWRALALVPLAGARLAYLAAVHAALAYAESVDTVFDLHRFDLLAAMHLPLPDDHRAEVVANRRLSAFWLNVPVLQDGYLHTEPGLPLVAPAPQQPSAPPSGGAPAGE
ncbi:hypothetical protein [Actinocorallia herbida]|uniref:hypothetical protein n=1 Tax=Actinocorallia herbida TaxID=58109 RepID=UPI0011CDEC4F|nr:hypothetical protein [Actinocorallia herbida]